MLGMPLPPHFLQPKTLLSRSWIYVEQNLNFYRVHLIVFTVTPLIFSAIMYASNGRYHIDYTDCLFNCVSAMTVTGLASINLSQLTGWQQAILFIQMSLGNIVTVSWVMVFIRKSYFRSKFEHIVKSRLKREEHMIQERSPRKDSWTRRAKFWLQDSPPHTQESDGGSRSRSGKKHKFGEEHGEKLRTDMIRRVGGAPQLVNPMGWISEERGNVPLPPVSEKPTQSEYTPPTIEVVPDEESQSPSATTSRTSSVRMRRRLSDPGRGSPSREDRTLDIQEKLPRFLTFDPNLQRLDSADDMHSDDITNRGRPPPQQRRDSRLNPLGSPTAANFPRTQTIEFAQPPRHGRNPSLATAHIRSDADTDGELRDRGRGRTVSNANSGLPRSTTIHTMRSRTIDPSQNQAQGLPLQHTLTAGGDVGFGGFPGPHQIISRAIVKWFPSLSTRFRRSMTIPVTATYTSQQGTFMSGTQTRTGVGMTGGRTKSVPYISFDAYVGKNSQFHGLTEDNLEELGGVEYRALHMLLMLVPLYHFGVQLFAFVIIAPYMSESRWRSVFTSQLRFLPSSWYSAFEVVSAYTNNGMSLVDTSLVPFQSAYPKLFVTFIIILAGNTAYPVFFRFMIWVISKLVPLRSRAHETLHFLLDHPRRCFVYLFPSHQTWFLLTFVALLTLTDWVSFLLLDIGNPEIGNIPVGRRMLLGLVQSAAVRSAGFATVSLANLAPAVKVLYVIMMYVSVYPIALAVRSTNVYEERSLGVLEEEMHENDPEPSIHGPRAQVWGSYLAWHARKQLAFDMWWIGFALVLVCIIERSKINNPETDSWFNIFPIMFELVSAYGTVGLSLGVPYDNFSFSGSLRPLSKLVICAVMLRGRHRGLPVAIDRAVMLPAEFEQEHMETVGMRSEDRRSRLTQARTQTQHTIDADPIWRDEMEGEPASPRLRGGQLTPVMETSTIRP